MASQTLLGIDTSTLSISVALVRLEADGSWRTLASRDRGASGPNHSTLLPGWVDELLGETGLTLAGLDGVAVSLGPGSFTGLRIALATGKGLAYGAEIPLAGASSLEAMALAAARLAPDAAAVVPILDARKQEVYAGFFRPVAGGVEALGDGPAEVVAKPERVAERLASLEGPLVLLGEGYFAYRAIFDEATAGLRAPPLDGLPETPPAAEVAVLGFRTPQTFSKSAIFALEPHYLRPSEAELKRQAS
ncbi:tRNA (adenosine(37)-N6)-threonylcarbamoyltransferase complex dimerization subunit type 1 TsaB [Vulgatibacter incomptus]|uniref:N(6)-L-threonylcarbamoyladenine synthase n=1 Tax=Vulgatibacter incomptus TaxID=1391653 RepID=A0A0K1PCW2_9BACT|nr:tRNA (adenosine(37)-N6)-threonylcarbamoyltransferase complex dimerization subunit type 1 TsaB [Vulgatibacter incomptus]AKU91360.1 hypothetical protein AKJ08_1747 [Vulgatibacter incomptus]